MAIYDGNGRGRPGTVRLKLDLGPKRWTVDQDLQRLWSSVGASTEGAFEAGSGVVSLTDQQPGKAKQTLLTLMNLPMDNLASAHAGTGRIVSARDNAFTDGGIFWGVEPPRIRETMMQVLKQNVPEKELSSDKPAFKILTGYDTARLKSDFWENKVKPNLTFTTCNLFIGAIAGKLANALGKQVGPELTTGPLQLDNVNKDVPGCWVTPKGGNVPRPGDFYSVPHKFDDGWVQKFGHVGVIGSIENGMWTSVDGGQGGRRSGVDYIKWVDRGKFDPAYFNGWIDIEVYFGS